MGKCINLIGERFYRLTVVSQADSGERGRTRWNCACECGNACVGAAKELRSGHKKSCGCLRKLVPNRRTHGHSTHPDYNTWRMMLRRCGDNRDRDYPNYGGRGIKVCERWNDFANFITDMGPRPAGMTIERDDVNGDYVPKNCRWATKREQANNRTDSRFIEYGGRRQTLMQWSRETGIKFGTLHRRLSAGWAVDRALSASVRGAL